ncbi:MAG: TrmH family RNA methyltransferase [Armatimonadota bacterium]
MLTSLRNPQVRLCRALAQRKIRDREGKFVLEGVRLLEEALAAGVELERAFCCPALARTERARRLARRLADAADLVEVSEEVFRTLSDTTSPQGLLAIARRPDVRLADLKLGQRVLLLAVEDVRDPGNLGTIIRSADAARATAVVLCGSCVDPTNPKVVRSTMGSLFHVPVVVEPDVGNLAQWATRNGIELLAASMQGVRFCHETGLPQRLGFLVGGEAHGLSRKAREAAAGTVSIPMPGHAESLNVAVAAGILLYEAVRQQSQRQPTQAKGDDGGK